MPSELHSYPSADLVYLRLVLLSFCCVYDAFEYGYTCAMVLMDRRPEESFWELVLSFHHGFHGLSSGHQALLMTSVFTH